MMPADPTSYIQRHRTYIRTLLTDGLQLGARRVISPPSSKAPGEQKTALIIPGDPNSALGSIGDAALLISTLTQLSKRYKISDIYLLGLADDEIEITEFGKIKIFGAFDRRHGSRQFSDLCQSASELYIIGADVLDGKYDAGYSCRVLTYANHAARANVDVTILGFSFNKSPNPSACSALKHLHGDVSINLRDEASHERFINDIGRDATLTADIAFLLNSTTPPTEVSQWIASRRARNELVIGVNINRHALSDLSSVEARINLVRAIGNQLPQTSRCGKIVNYVLIPHDLKPSSGDIEMLSALHASLQQHRSDQVFYVEMTDPRAIKGLAAQLDALVTGRMHLAIAALGVCTPVLCIDYQDKFEGLLRRFGMNVAESLCSKDGLVESIQNRVLTLLEKRLSIKTTIQAQLPAIKALSALNFRRLKPVEHH